MRFAGGGDMDREPFGVAGPDKEQDAFSASFGGPGECHELPETARGGAAAPTHRPARIAVMSDLHLEFEPDYWKAMGWAAKRGGSGPLAEIWRRREELAEEPDHPADGPDLRGLKAGGADLLLLAGDVHLGVKSVAYADAAARYLGCPAFLCCGNHEFYGSDGARLIPAMREAAAATAGRVAYLERDRINLEVAGRRLAVLGATLWTDYRVNGGGPLALLDAERGLNDHLMIRWEGGRFAAARARDIHVATRDWLGREIPRARDEADAVLVMTHHAPIPEANPPQHRGGQLAPAFVSDMRGEILDWQPDLWVWGHTHFSMRDALGRTRLVSAQRGYVGSESEAFEFAAEIVEV